MRIAVASLFVLISASADASLVYQQDARVLWAAFRLCSLNHGCESRREVLVEPVPFASFNDSVSPLESESIALSQSSELGADSMSFLGSQQTNQRDCAERGCSVERGTSHFDVTFGVTVDTAFDLAGIVGALDNGAPMTIAEVTRVAANGSPVEVLGVADSLGFALSGIFRAGESYRIVSSIQANTGVSLMPSNSIAWTLTTSQIHAPEPSTAILLAIGLALLRRRY